MIDGDGGVGVGDESSADVLCVRYFGDDRGSKQASTSKDNDEGMRKRVRTEGES